MIFIYIAVISAVIIGILCLIPGFTSSIKDSQGHHPKGNIASLEGIALGDQKQWMLIRGADITNPVILFLHGGPGTSDMGLLRRNMSELEKHFVVVSWDQRGAGKSFAANSPNSSMRIEQFVSDACELTAHLCHRFNQEKIYLAGHSWGSVLGVLTVQKHPELYHAYIGIGQVANMIENEQLTYEWTLEQATKANDKSSVNKLIEIGIPPYTGKWQKKFMTQRRLLGKFGGEVYISNKGAFPLVIGSLIKATEYSIIDKVNFFRGIFTTIRLVWPELMTINLKKTALQIEVSVYFILGRHDHEAPSTIAEQYFNELKAPYKELFWFENSAHLPHIEEKTKFIDLMINHILPSSNIKQRVTS